MNRPATLIAALLVSGLFALGSLGRAETFQLPGNVPLEMKWLPAGTFWMGAYVDELDSRPEEFPQHRVTLSHGFWLGQYEVTKAQWQAVMGTTPWKGQEFVDEAPNTPAVYISWNDAQAFIAKLNQLNLAGGRTFRLPSEAEWEYACRAGTRARFYWGDDFTYNDVDQYAWSRTTVLLTPQKAARPVGTKKPNAWGLFDMSGNVKEWCQDWLGPYAAEPVTDPTGPATGDKRARRGGNWQTPAGECRSARRSRMEPENSVPDCGFRLAASAAPVTVAVPGPEQTDVFVAGQEGVNTYRIPTLLVAPDGSLLVFCEARKEAIHDASPTDMVLRRSADSGRTWQPTQLIVRGEGKEAIMNPCPVLDRTNHTIILFCINVNKYGEFHNQPLLLTSADNGHTWSKPVDIAARITNLDDTFVPGPGVGIQMSNGRLVVPGYSGVFRDVTKHGMFSRVIYSDDHGQTWTLGQPVAECSDESQVVELADGRLMLNMRGDMGKGCRGVAWSSDGGQSWSPVFWDRQLPECPCQASIVRYSLAKDEGQDRLLFANPDNIGHTFGVIERTKMTVRLSNDDGKTWPVARLLHAGPSSYSSLVRLPDGDIGIVFEGGEKHRREWIRFMRFSLAWLTAEKP